MPKEQPIIVYDLEGNYLSEFESVKSASIILGIDPTGISKAANGVTLSVGSYQIRKKNPIYDNLSVGDITRVRPDARIVGKYWMGKLICTYPSPEIAAIKNNISRAKVVGSMGYGTITHGFLFKELN